MTDQELLEAAAMAAGCKNVAIWGESSPFARVNFDEDGRGSGTRFNPFNDDGDAFRLAVKLNMGVQSWGGQDGGYALARWASDDGACVAEAFDAGGDPAAAARRAIVRAAAEIGKTR